LRAGFSRRVGRAVGLCGRLIGQGAGAAVRGALGIGGKAKGSILRCGPSAAWLGQLGRLGFVLRLARGGVLLRVGLPALRTSRLQAGSIAGGLRRVLREKLGLKRSGGVRSPGASARIGRR